MILCGGGHVFMRVLRTLHTRTHIALIDVGQTGDC